MKKIISVLSCITIALCGMAQNLKTFSLSVEPNTSNGKSYISIEKQNVFTETEAAAIKESIDLLYSMYTSGKDTVKEFTNMSIKSEAVPKNLQGTQTAIVAISWDMDLWNKCKTAADLKRMTGYMTNNSFSYHAEMASNHTGEINYPFFIFQMANGKRGIIYVQKGTGAGIKITIKKEP